MRARPLSEALHRYVVPWLQRDWPIDWAALFARRAPLVVEIGFGNGLFLIEQARRNPDVNFVGIELSWGWVQHLAGRLDAAGLPNVRLIHGEGHVAMQYLFASNTIQTVCIDFPDPWPKKRHHARRLIQPALVTLLHDRLRPGGEVTIATDHRGYADWIAAILENQRDLRPSFSTTAVHELASRRPTKYEQKARGANLPVYYFVWRKPSSSPPTTLALRRHAMPHVVLEGPHDLEKTFGACRSRTWSEAQQGVAISTTLLRTYRELTAEAWLVELVVKEGRLVQQVGVSIVVRSAGQILLKLSAMGFPRPTWGVQRAVWHVAEMLQEDNPQLRVIRMSMGARDQASEATAERSGRRGAAKRPSVPSES
jgi:tRNA (guanine-N7-)-methyltransferase